MLWRNLDEMSAVLGSVVAEATQAAGTQAQTNALVSAAATGDAAAVERLAASMSTADLQRVQARLRG